MSDVEAQRQRVIRDFTALVRGYKAEGMSMIAVSAFVHTCVLTMAKAAGMTEEDVCNFVRGFYRAGAN